MMNTIDLDKLEQAARAAESNGAHIYTNPRDSDKYRQNEAYIDAVPTDVVLELIRRLRAAEENATRYIWLRDSDMLGSPSAEIAFAFERYTGSRLDGVIDAAIEAERIAAQGASHD